MSVSPAAAISIKGLSFSYDRFDVLEDVNLEIDARDFVMFVGPNGGGKTTLLKIMLGLLPPTTGTVRVLGRSPAEARRGIGYMPQHAQMDPGFPALVKDVVLMGRIGRARGFGPYAAPDKKAALEVLEEVGLCELRNRPFSALSGGQRQRALIARALASEPDLLLLDEPTAHLDITSEGDLYELLRELNNRMTVVMASHDVGFVSEFVKTVVCVKRKVVVHPTSEITGEVIRELYGRDVRMVRHDHGGDGEGDRCRSL